MKISGKFFRVCPRHTRGPDHSIQQRREHPRRRDNPPAALTRRKEPHPISESGLRLASPLCARSTTQFSQVEGTGAGAPGARTDVERYDDDDLKRRNRPHPNPTTATKMTKPHPRAHLTLLPVIPLATWTYGLCIVLDTVIDPSLRRLLLAARAGRAGSAAGVGASSRDGKREWVEGRLVGDSIGEEGP